MSMLLPRALRALGSSTSAVSFLGLVVLLVSGLVTSVVKAEALAYYLPEGVEYDASVPTPASVLGYEVGEQHVRPDQLAIYMAALAESSSRVQLEVQGRTHESRPLLLMTISTPENLQRLEELRQAHLAASGGEGESGELTPERLESLPAVLWLGYSIHGDEASGSNASMLTAYHLAAGRGEAVEELLEKTIVLLDPSLNPDGLGRFAHWATMHRGEVPVASRDHREHRQPWPTGRTNHYWFDLNRDWMPSQHPESQARLKTYYRWRPHLLGDYHEMGSDSTYFFQPGVPTRVNPWIPDANQQLTRTIAGYHARKLDDAGVLYYSEESFDDFYPGKGSTYPDLVGSIGVLFEQASARGRLHDTRRGAISFPFTIRNQFLTSLSMLEAAREQREELIRYRRDFYREAREAGRQDPVGAYLVSFPEDSTRAREFLQLLLRHHIEVRPLTRTVEVAGQRFEAGQSWAVPVAQKAYRLVKALFEARKEFEDSTFYDVSAWTLPLAFDARSAEARAGAVPGDAWGEPLQEVEARSGSYEADAQAVAYAFSWRDHGSMRALGQLLGAGVTAQVATRGVSIDGEEGSTALGPGAVIVPVRRGADDRSRTEAILGQVAEQEGLDILPVAGGLTSRGEDLGSPTMMPLTAPKPLLVVGGEVDTYEAGELWHLIDHHFRLPLTLVEMDRVASMDLSSFTHVLLVSGKYDAWDAEVSEKLESWVRSGGVLVASSTAAHWVGKSVLDLPEAETAPEPMAILPSPEQELEGAPPAASGDSAQRYADYEATRQAATISGAVFAARIDTTHPLGFGFGDEELPVFRTGIEPLVATGNPWETVAAYTEAPLLAGYAPADAPAQLAGTPAVTAQRLDRGTVIRLADDPAFRGFWFGTQRLVANALFFGRSVRPTPVIR
ncbi:MAG: M14 family metallopeptidase [Acidobacteriota bacterium]|nr:M14 family metallopeptidase [Acidobacteriota bacterium]